MLEPIKASVAEENQSNIFENSGNDRGFPFKIFVYGLQNRYNI